MKKRFYYTTTAMLSVMVMTLFSSCLKDSRYIDFPNAGNVANMPQSGMGYFSQDAVLADTVKFGVDYATANPNPAVTITLAVDPTLVTSYDAANPAINYQLLPSADYKLSTTTVNIPAGAQYQIVTLVVNRAALDPSQSYMLPVKIASTSAGIISANSSIHYFHIIGNDFAGSYIWDYYRYNANTILPTPSAGTTLGQAGTISPVSPTEFTMLTGYNNSGVHYDVTFTRTVSGGVVSYSNWNVTFVPSDVAAGWTPAGISVTQPPVFLILDPVNKEFKLQYIDFNGSAYRYIIDDYHKH